MNKRLLEIYALSICFVSVGCLSIFGGIFIYSLAELSFPSKMDFPPIHYPPPIYSQSGTMAAPILPGQPVPEISEQVENSDENNSKIQEEQKRFEKLEIERMRIESIRSIVRSIIIILIASFVFAIHWRMAKNARTSNNT